MLPSLESNLPFRKLQKQTLLAENRAASKKEAHFKCCQNVL